MSNLQFRAWNKNTKTMVDLKAITPLALDPVLNQDGVFIPFSDEYIVMQWTGIYDYNKRPIYDGDLILFTPKDKRKIITRPYNFIFWDSEKLRWMMMLVPFIPNMHEKCPLHVRMSEAHSSHGGRYTIVGNIYENAEEFERLKNNGG